MVKESKRVGLPVALMRNLLLVAQTVGVNRMVSTTSMSHFLGNPPISKEEQHLSCRSRMGAALDALATDTKEQTIFKVGI